MGINFTDIAVKDPVIAAILNDRFDQLDVAISGSGIAALLTNNSGGTLATNDCIIIDDTNNDSVTTTTIQGDINSPIILIHGGLNGENVMGLSIGQVSVIVDGSGSRGDFIRTSTTAKRVNPIAALSDGCFGILLENAGGAGNVVNAYLFGLVTIVDHDASKVTSGIFTTARIPNLAASKITAGQLLLERGGTEANLGSTGGSNQIVKQSSVGAALTVSVLTQAEIPDLGASKIVAGTIALERGGAQANLGSTGGTNQIVKQSSVGAALTVSVLTQAEIPDLGASKIVAGTMALARISQGSVTQHQGAINHNLLLNYAIGQHRIINDAGTSSTELWSASKISAEITAVTASEVIGVIKQWSADVAPNGYLICDGSAISRITYSVLHTLLKDVGGVNNYGWGNGDGSTTFNLPDMRGRVSIGIDNGANRVTDSNADTLNNIGGGAETHTLTISEMPNHSHDAQGNAFFTTGGAQSLVGLNPSLDLLNNTGSTGGGGTHNNLQPWVALNYIIFTGV